VQPTGLHDTAVLAALESLDSVRPVAPNAGGMAQAALSRLDDDPSTACTVMVSPVLERILACGSGRSNSS